MKRQNQQPPPSPRTPPRSSQSYPVTHLALHQASSRDGDESFMSDITGDVGMHSTPPPKRKQQQQVSIKATSILSGAASNIYQGILNKNTSNGDDYEDYHDDDDDASNALNVSHYHDGNSFVTADQTAMPKIAEHDDDDARRMSRKFSRGFDFLNDATTEMTYSRRIALHLMRHSWYYPKLEPPHDDEHDATTPPMSESKEAALRMEAYPFSVTKKEYPSLEKAWVYFEHVALPRHLVQPKADLGVRKSVCTRIVRKMTKANKQLSRAEPGERNLPTKLYDHWTPHAQLGDFGLGIGLYFSTLRALTILTLLAGLMNITNIQYFASLEYSNGQEEVSRNLIRGSTICTNVAWVICESCTVDLFPADRLAIGTNVATGQNVTLGRKNLCDAATMEQGFVNYATLLFIIIGIFFLNIYLKRMEVAFDEDEQTAQDYSIVVTNPPADAKDPQEWKDYFGAAFGAHVTACTVAVDNDLLVRSLVERREVLRRIEMMVEPGTSLDKLTLTRLGAKEERERRLLNRIIAMVSPGIPEFVARLVVLTARVQGLAQQNFPVTNVFITFETEADQRKVLSELSLGSLDVSRNNLNALASRDYAFRGNQVLAVAEPDEPNTIRWQDLNETFMARLKQQFMTFLATIAAIAVIAVIIAIINGSESAAASAFAISISNAIFPMFAKLLNSLESHSSEGSKQRSLFSKIALFRWFNTAIVLTIITPFTHTISNREGLINKVYALFYAEIVTTNVILLADPMGHIKRHYFAPRAKSQDAMNTNFSGTEMELAERYTNMTKILFLALWYCSIYPAALFMCSATLLIAYYVDKFALMRIWKRQPHLGATISEFSRHYFFSLAIVAMAIASSYYWSAFPFDNICEAGSSLDGGLVGTYTVTYALNSQALPPESFPSDTPAYKYCNQDFIRYDTRSFPFIPSLQAPGAEWMTPEQEQLTAVYGWSVVGVVGFILLQFIWGWIGSIRNMFRSSYKPNGDDQGINFSDVPSISTYVPQIESKIYSYPLLACNVDKIDMELLDWTDPDRPHSFYDLSKDAKILIQGMDVSANTVFSQVAHWPPATTKNQYR
ncbi:hypothetical protein MPSEU_000123600 [Mayamaea pseudoterrestris]|nr:hypothetical protein MPSEU_000123600 [Mayamaea pseudoterrestris]